MSEESRKIFRADGPIKTGADSKNAWFVRLGDAKSFNGFSISLNIGQSESRGIHEGDALIIVTEKTGRLTIIVFASVYRKRSSLNETTIYFDGVVPVESERALEEMGIRPPNMAADIARLDWTTFEMILRSACGFDYSSFPSITGNSPKEQAYLRELLQNAVLDDLLGPADGPEEEIAEMSVRDRYLVGKLAPQENEEEFDETLFKVSEELGEVSGRIDDDEGEGEFDNSKNQSLVPSSIGFTFCVDKAAENIWLTVKWGRYERRVSEQGYEKNGKPARVWKRIPSGGSKKITLKPGTIESFPVDNDCPGVLVQGSISDPLNNGDRLVTLFLINTQVKPEQNQDQAWVFQPEMIVTDPAGHAIFRRRPVITSDGTDEEREALEMIYRHHVEFAVGHGISVHATPAPGDNEHALEVRTCVIPCHEVPVTETPGLEEDDRPAMRRMVEEGLLDMKRLASLSRQELINALSVITDDYEEWIGEQRARIGTALQEYDYAASDALDRCTAVLARLREGISVLESNDSAIEAFSFANEAMALQRVRSIYSLQKRRGENPDLEKVDVPKNRSWRPFQLAFMLLSIPALVDPTHRDRTESVEAYADLLWFPTGGGKTEAYLGVAAFTMAIRRIQDELGGYDSGRGLSVIMRYTLRLLTLQQFQRASALICAMEVLRRTNSKKWGETPFTIGLWVGKRVTPNTTQDSHDAIEKERDNNLGGGSTPAQLTTCPWCGSEIAPGREIRVDRDILRTFIYCGDKYGRCDFSHAKSKGMGLPVLVVDDEIYRHPPTMLIATVDKFAMMAWRGQIRTLFGRVTHECPRHGLLWPEAKCNGIHRKKGGLQQTSACQIKPIRPPDLIIQDEFHLISGPLGTMVGLYETAVDELSTWSMDGKDIRPKVIASTATVRKAADQINNVFLRKVSVFPPHGLDVEDNFFSIQRAISEKPGRRYIGVCSPGSSRPAVLIRVYVAFLTAAQSIFERFGQAADPYMTVIGYFNSLRELGGMKRLAEDDVQTRSFRVEMSNVARPGLRQRSVKIVDELTSRVSNKDIPKKLDQLEIKFKKAWEKGETRAIDIVLATNMLSVGVDVNRLGLMVVNGQPKSTAEYIQATSRVGRSFPGLVCTVLTWSRPRDLSHYETFEHYHSTFYKHVEAQSVTPFAPRALDRGLTGTMISLLRLDNESLNPNTGAQNMNRSTTPEAEKVKRNISERAWKVKHKIAGQNAEKMAAERLDRWVKEANRPGRRLGYETEYGQGELAALLKKPGVSSWEQFTVPMSLREVEPGVRLIMDQTKLPEPPSWQVRTNDTNS